MSCGATGCSWVARGWWVRSPMDHWARAPSSTSGPRHSCARSPNVDDESRSRHTVDPQEPPFLKTRNWFVKSRVSTDSDPHGERRPPPSLQQLWTGPAVLNIRSALFVLAAGGLDRYANRGAHRSGERRCCCEMSKERNARDGASLRGRLVSASKTLPALHLGYILERPMTLPSGSENIAISGPSGTCIGGMTTFAPSRSASLSFACTSSQLT
jgi:hypothetical protein